jgi:RNA polymerase sigma-B factor
VASIGLLKALDRFDPEREYKFSTYAIPTIQGELKRYFRDYGWVMRIPRADQELAVEVRRATEEASRELGRKPRPHEIAACSRYGVEDVIRGLDAAAAARPDSLDAVTASDELSTGAARSLGRDDKGFDQVESRDAVSRGLDALPSRDAQVLYMHFYADFTQTEIAELIGVSQMQVSRIIRRALDPARWLAELTPPDSTPTEEEACSSQSQSSC